MNAASYITKPKKIAALTGNVTLKRGSITIICWVLTIVHIYCKLADKTRFIIKFPAINPFVALDKVAVVSAEILLTNPVLRGGMDADKVFQF